MTIIDRNKKNETHKNQKYIQIIYKNSKTLWNDEHEKKIPEKSNQFYIVLVQ